MRRLLPLLLLLLTGCAAVPTAPFTGQAAPRAGATAQPAGVKSYFTRAGEHPELALIAVMDGARQSLDVAIYSLTKAEIVKAMLNAHKRGVAVRVITDETQAGGRARWWPSAPSSTPASRSSRTTTPASCTSR